MSSSHPDLDPYNGPDIYPQAVALPILAALACLLSIPPLILQINNKNLPVIMLLLGNALMNLQNTINPIIWPNDNTEVWFSGVVLCDIEAKLQVGLSAIPPNAATCICRQLATILSAKRATVLHPAPSSVRRRLIFEIALCILFPVFLMSIHILVQPWRYSIYGISGCQYCLHRSFMTWAMILAWQIPISILGLVYSVLTIFRLVRHQQQVSTLLTTANVSKARFAMVFVLATISAVVYTPLVLYLYLKSPEGNIQAWSWKKIHRPGWNRTIVKFESGGEAGLDRWMQVASGFVLFAVFGLGGDAMTMYSCWARVTGIQKIWNRLWLTGSRTDEAGVIGQGQQLPTNGQRPGPPTLYGAIDDLDMTMEVLNASSSEDGLEGSSTGVGIGSPAGKVH